MLGLEQVRKIRTRRGLRELMKNQGRLVITQSIFCIAILDRQNSYFHNHVFIYEPFFASASLHQFSGRFVGWWLCALTGFGTGSTSRPLRLKRVGSQARLSFSSNSKLPRKQKYYVIKGMGLWQFEQFTVLFLSKSAKWVRVIEAFLYLTKIY